MITIVVIFIGGYAFHWIYKGFDKVIAFVINSKRDKEEK